MTRGDWSVASIAALHLRFPELSDETAVGRLLDADRILKVWDPGKHPRWPAHSTEGHGGQFRPADGNSLLTPISDSPPDKQEQERRRRQKVDQQRRDRPVSALLRGLLQFSSKLGPALAPLVQMIEIMQDVNDLSPELKASLGPAKDLNDLRADRELRSFDTFDAFKRYYGSAGEGYEWHHIVEQSANFPATQLQTTDNIIRVPKFIHEETYSIWSREFENGHTIRDFVRLQDFETQRQLGLGLLRSLGVIK